MKDDLQAKVDALLRKQKQMQESLNQLGEDAKLISQELERCSVPLPPKVERVLIKEVKPDESVMSEPAVFFAETKSKGVESSKEISVVNSGEWEIDFGRIWLVRIGVLFLLTGLIFLSTYAYKNWLFNAGAVMKVSFFMLISFTLIGLGMWLDKWKEKLRQYGRVVASGGLAAGYYTIYASHFVSSLRLVESPIFAGILLTLWAGVMLAYAVWKKSRVVAVMAIGLAFYGTIVNPSGWLSLFSALLLSSAGMWLMVKFRWMAIGLGTVFSAYVAHAFWLGVYPQFVEFGVRVTYLASYWLLFTVVLSLSRAREMPEKVQRAFCAINNGSAWCLTVFLIPEMIPHEEIGWISIGVGSLWVAIAGVSRMDKVWSKSLAVIYGYQGILIATLGIFLVATGYTRFLVMSVEACVLLAGARYFGGTLARALSAYVLLCSLITASLYTLGGELAPWWSYAALTLVSGIYTGLVSWDRHKEAKFKQIAIVPAIVTWLVLLLGVFDQWSYTLGLNGLWLSASVVIWACFLIEKSRKIPGLRELSMMAIFVAFFGVWKYMQGYAELSLYELMIPILGISTFWYMSPQIARAWRDDFLNQINTVNLEKIEEVNPFLECVFSILFWIMVGVTVGNMIDGRLWMIVGAVLAFAGNAISEYIRRAIIGKLALIFYLLVIMSSLYYGGRGSELGWIPIIILLVHLAVVDVFWSVISKGKLRVILSFILVCVVAIYAFQKFERPDLAFTLLGLGLISWAYSRKSQPWALVGGAFPMILACFSTLVMHGAQDGLRYIPVLATLVAHALLWHKTQDVSGWRPIRVILLFVGLASLLVTASRHVLDSFNGAGLAICWALLATLLFCVGLKMRCRPYRLIGLYVLGAAVFHVVFIDVMRMETLGRILSFIILGLVLLALGFLYNKFQETIRKFL